MSEGIRKLRPDTEDNAPYGERLASLEQQVKHNKEYIEDHHQLIQHVADSVDQISKQVAGINEKLSLSHGVLIGVGAVIAAVWAVFELLFERIFG